MNKTSVSSHLLENYENYYDEGDSEWRRLGAVDKVDNIVSLCKGVPHKTVIEIGAGEGSVLKRMSEVNFGQELYGLEISPSGAETIRNKGIERLVECAVYDGYQIPYEDDRFDLAILSHVIEHVEQPRRLLFEAMRIAKHVFIEVPLEDTARLPQDYVFDKVGHINFYSPKTIRRLLQTSNFKVLNQIVVNPSKSVHTYHKGKKGLVNYHIKQFMLKLFPRLAPYIFSYHSALLCQPKPSEASSS